MAEIQTAHVQAEDVEQMLTLVTRINADPYTDASNFVNQVVFYQDKLNLSFLNKLKEFELDPDCVVMLLRGLPVVVPPEIPTPTTRESRPPKADKASEVISVLIASYLGEPFSFAEENLGHLVQNIFPIEQHATMQISSNASELTFHVDAAFHPCVPDYTLLTCLRSRSSQQVLTYYVPMQPFVNQLSKEEQELLKMERFEIEEEMSYGSSSVVSAAIWEQRYGEDVFRFDISLTRGKDERSQKVVERVTNKILENPSSVSLSAGDLVVLKNLRCIHARSAYSPNYDGRDRWLQRVYIVRDSRILDPFRISQRQVASRL